MSLVVVEGRRGLVLRWWWCHCGDWVAIWQKLPRYVWSLLWDREAGRESRALSRYVIARVMRKMSDEGG